MIKMVDELKKNLEARKFQLVNMLKFDSETIALERQHQMYGAVKEIDLMLGMLIEFQKDQKRGLDLKGVNKDELMAKLAKRLR